jgi:drug/metabolite transporter (DMT)-like permease
VSLLDRALPPSALFQLVLLTAAWGANAPVLRYCLRYLPPFGAAGCRFLIGLGVVVLIARVQKVPLVPRREELKSLAWLGLLFTAQILLLNAGSALTQAGRQALLINSYPLFVPIFAHLFLPGDRLTAHKVLGTLLAFLGVLFIFGEKAVSGSGALIGDLLIALSALLFAGIAVFTSILVRNNHPYRLLFGQMVFAIPCFFGLSLLVEPQRYVWSPLVGAAIAYQGIVVGGLCFVGWTSMLRKYSPGRLSVGFFLTPIFGALFSYLLLGEPVTPGLATGGIAILGGLLIVTRSPRATPPAERQK